MTDRAYPVKTILPSDYMKMLKDDIGSVATVKQYFRSFARNVDDEQNAEPEIHYNIFTKWMRKRTYIASSDICPWGPLKNMIEVAIVHYHTILSRILYNSDRQIPDDMLAEYGEFFNQEFLAKVKEYQMLSRLFVDWSSEAWPYFEANQYFLDMMSNMTFKHPKNDDSEVQAGEDILISDIMQAYPGCLIAFPKNCFRIPEGFLSHMLISHQDDIEIVLISSEAKAFRTINTISTRTIKECLELSRPRIERVYLELVFSILLYFMMKPDDKKPPYLKKKSNKTILIEGRKEEIEVWRAGKLGYKLSIVPGYIKINILATHKKRPHWRKGHWRFYKSCSKLTWIAPMLINKHLLLKK